MTVGKIHFDGKKHPVMDAYDNVCEFIEAVIDMYYVKKHYVIRCKKCGIESAPFLNPICGPYNSGLFRTKKKKGFICHWCRIGYVDKKSFEDRVRFAKKINKELELKVNFYKIRYPWVRIRRI